MPAAAASIDSKQVARDLDPAGAVPSPAGDAQEDDARAEEQPERRQGHLDRSGPEDLQGHRQQDHGTSTAREKDRLEVE